MSAKKTAKTAPQAPAAKKAPKAKTAKTAKKAPAPAPGAEAQPEKVSALDAAAKVLAEEGRAMSCQELIDAMAAKGYWTSPTGKTPSATLYAALLRELQAKGKEARFVKVGRGRFALADGQ